ncbi:hypothetical protein GGF46_001763 [Coemansia sp. RSA 552]|nr:hypothetical protein GGF46_001763 [Coemansia sp. RSA 552]
MADQIAWVMAKRALEIGPEDPAEMSAVLTDLLWRVKWKIGVMLGIAGSISGLMAVFLLGVFFWRRELVNRVSLRLIFAISTIDFLCCILQPLSDYGIYGSACRTFGFFIEYTMFASVYLSASIAFNLQMTFLRKSRAPLPKYVEYLYYIVPLTVVFLQLLPQYIWAAKNGECRAIGPVMPATTRYIIHIIFIQMGVPTLFVLYNTVVSIWVIISLYLKQRKVTQALNAATGRTQDLLADSGNGNTSGNNTSGLGSRSTAGGSLSTQQQQQLKAARKVYRACMRIALYPLAPICWWIMLTVFYIAQYYITFTWKRDPYIFMRFLTLNWFASVVTAFVNFIVFVTDPAMYRVISEVRLAIRHKYRSVSASTYDSHGTLYHSKHASKDKGTGIAITECDSSASDTGSGHGVDGVSLDSTDFDNKDSAQYHPAGSPDRLEANRSYATSIAGLEDDVVVRRVKRASDAQSFLDEM